MKAKTYLQEIRRLDKKIENKQMEVKSLYDLLSSVTVVPKEVDVQSSGNDTKFEDMIAKIIDLKDEINRDIDRYVDTKLEAIKLINQMEDEDYAGILIRRYVNYESWKKIADDLGYTRQGINKRHGIALLEFQKIVDKSLHKFT